MVLVVIMTLSPRLYRARCLVTPFLTDVLYEIQGYNARLQAYEAASFAQNMAFQTAAANSHEAHQTAQHNNIGRGSYNNRFGSNRGRGGYSSRGRGFHQQTTATAGNNTRPTC